MSPRFSIIVPLYNKADYVRKALESIVNQTFQDYEVILVNDGSTDNSLDVVKELFERFKILDFRFKILDQKNAGVAAARNNGVAKSKGEYVCFLDADDWWEPTYLEEMNSMITDYPDAGLYCTNYVYYKPGKTHVMLDIPSGYMNYPREYVRCGAMPITSNTSCIPKSIYKEMGGFPKGIKYGEDFLLWAKIALHYKIAYSEKPLAYYNNDVPAHLRATRNMHKPEHHMLFNMQDLEDRTATLQDATLQENWKALLDQLRVIGLFDYWLSPKYHEVAEAELKKVDWSRQPKSARHLYERPLWMLRMQQRIMQIGSYYKQEFIKLKGKI